MTAPADSDWKQDFANDAEKALDHPIVAETVAEYVENMRRNYSVDLSVGLPFVGLAKVRMAVALVARAQALGIDPDLLRLSAEEADAEIIAMARRFHDAGKPVIVLATQPTQPANPYLSDVEKPCGTCSTSGTVYERHGLPLHLGWCRPDDGFPPLQSKRWEAEHGLSVHPTEDEREGEKT